MGRLRRTLPLLVWLAALAAGLVMFHGLGSGPLAAPALTEPTSWSAWAAEREPVEATAAVLRLVVLTLAWYLVGTTTVGLVARLAHAARLVRIADTLTIPVVRRLLQGALGVGLATAMVAAAGPSATPGGGAGGEVTLRAAPAEPHDGGRLRLMQAAPAADDGSQRPDPPDVVGLRRIDDGAGERPLPLELLHEDSGGAAATTDAAPASPTTEDMSLTRIPDLHEVRPGESLWIIARDTLAGTWDRRPSDGEVAGYWRQMIEDNRDRLHDPDNPDLIFPGQEFALPAPPPPTGDRT